jgi:polyisoprenoid-binding protein YceI
MMKEKKMILLMMAALLLISSSVFSSDKAAAPAKQTKTGWTGNQLMGNSQPPVTQRPATEVGSVQEISATKAGSLLVLQSGSALYLVGDSTLHKYEMGAKSLMGSAAVEISASDLKVEGALENALKKGAVKSMALVVPVNNLKSKESGLDSNAYKALKAKDNPNIKFALTDETLSPGKESGSYVMKAKGSLTVAGETVPITLEAEATFKEGQVRLKGVQKLKMTDFKVTPPSISLLVASITCTDEIEIHYDVVFAPKL